MKEKRKKERDGGNTKTMKSKKIYEKIKKREKELMKPSVEKKETKKKEKRKKKERKKKERKKEKVATPKL